MSSPTWELRIAPSAGRAIARLPEKIATAVVEFIVTALPTDPVRMSNPLRALLAGMRVARRGHYRVIFELDADTQTIDVLRVEHRADAYRTG